MHVIAELRNLAGSGLKFNGHVHNTERIDLTDWVREYWRTTVDGSVWQAGRWDHVVVSVYVDVGWRASASTAIVKVMVTELLILSKHLMMLQWLLTLPRLPSLPLLLLPRLPPRLPRLLLKRINKMCIISIRRSFNLQLFISSDGAEPIWDTVADRGRSTIT